MRKALLVQLLAVSSNAAAEWVQVGNSSSVILYADPATIRRAGEMVKMWDIYDLKKARTIANRSVLSIKAQQEYDCKDERSRTLHQSGYSENMGAGNAVYLISDPQKWKPIPPESISETLWKFACGKK